MDVNCILNTDCLSGLKKLPDKCIDCCVTSPPYFRMRDYGVDGQIGLESTPEEYVSKLAEIFQEVFRVLKNTGTLWLNLGDRENALLLTEKTHFFAKIPFLILEKRI